MSKSWGKPGLEPRLVATMLITRVVDDGRNLDALTDSVHGLTTYLALPTRDQALARAITVTALRHRRPIELVISKVANRAPPKGARFLINMLHVAISQVLFLEVEDRAAIDLAVTAIGQDERTERFKAFANAVLRRVAREKQQLLEVVSSQASILPRWMEQTIRSDFGKERLQKISKAVRTEPSLDISVKSEPEKWANILGGTLLPTGSVRLATRSPVHELAGYAEGEWWVQDAAAALPAQLIPAHCTRVLDLCAAPGGKTAQLASAGHKVTAVEKSKPRMERLRANLERLKLEVETIEADILEWETESVFDAVLLDAPCSSSGTIRRHPDVMWSKKADDMPALAELQFSLLEAAIPRVKPGGVLVFANCSIFKIEGENLLERTKKQFADIELEPVRPEELCSRTEIINGQGAVRTLPYQLGSVDGDQDGADGFFACRFLKK